MCIIEHKCVQKISSDALYPVGGVLEVTSHSVSSSEGNSSFIHHRSLIAVLYKPSHVIKAFCLSVSVMILQT